MTKNASHYKIFSWLFLDTPINHLYSCALQYHEPYIIQQVILACTKNYNFSYQTSAALGLSAIHFPVSYY